MPTEDGLQSPATPTRRAVVRTGAKLAYAAPLVAASLSLTRPAGVAAISPAGDGDPPICPVLNIVCDGNTVPSNEIGDPLCDATQSVYICCKDLVTQTGCCTPGVDCPGDEAGACMFAACA